MDDSRNTYLPPERLSYRVKRLLLGTPLTNDKLATERVGKPTALAVLSSDVMSSSAYATEQILVVLVGVIGIGAYKLVMPITIGICLVLVAVTLSYLEVIKAFPKAGGAYMVTRETFGLNFAQIASAALLIDYTLTVAVSIAAGVDALISAVPVLEPLRVEIAVLFVVLIAYGNLRGIREAGRTFALPTFIFIVNMAILILTGLYKWVFTNLSTMSIHQQNAYAFGLKSGGGLLAGASFFIVAQAFANGGTALTGTEAISNGVSIFRTKAKIGHKLVDGVKGQAHNARVTLMSMSLILGAMFVGVSLLASKIHPVPRTTETPTVVAQIADVVYGDALLGHIFYLLLQFATMTILVLAANTSFTGFPLLASFAAEDSFLPRQLTRRGHRLVFSNGIIVLTFVSIILLVATRANVSSLVALYAIGVFTGFTLAGAGMVKYHLKHRESHYKRRIFINGAASVLSFFVDIMFIVTKFTEGAWVVVVLMPLMVYAFIHLHRQYVAEEEILEKDAPRVCEMPILRRHSVIVLVERLDLATARVIQYARTLGADDLRAVHFILDSLEAREVEDQWQRLGLSRLPLDVVECGDRRLGKAVIELISSIASDGQTEVSVLLPRRVYAGAFRRILHDRTAERLSSLVSQIPHAAATIIPFNMPRLKSRSLAIPSIGRENRRAQDLENTKETLEVKDVFGAQLIRDITYRSRAKIAGRVVSMRLQPRAGIPSLECVIADSSGKLTLVFQGRRTVTGVEPGSRLVAEGMVGMRNGSLIMINPSFELKSTSPLG